MAQYGVPPILRLDFINGLIRTCWPIWCAGCWRMVLSITVASRILEVGMAARSSLDRQFVPFREPNSHSTRTEHVQNEG